MIRTLAILLVLCVLPPFARAGIVSGPIVNPANGHSYYFLSDQTWNDAEVEAQGLGGHLVTINDAAENQWVLDTFSPAGTGVFWIGLNDFAVEGDFQWASGEAVSFSNWGGIEPTNTGINGEDFALIVSTTKNGFIAGEWNDAPITSSAFGVAEVGLAAVPEPNSVFLLLLGGGLFAWRRRSSHADRVVDELAPKTRV